MAKLRNTSSEVKYVGGWQMNQNPPGQVLRVRLMPGEEVDIPGEVLHDPAVRALAETADFKLVDVALVAGGPVDVDPELRKGEARLLRTTLDFSSLASDATATKSVGLGRLPVGTVISQLVLRLGASFDDGGGVGLAAELGSASDPDSLMLSEDLGAAPGRIVPTRSLATTDTIDGGIDLVLLLTADSGTLDAMTAGSVEILLYYFVC
jgi:hypothetical protein